MFVFFLASAADLWSQSTQGIVLGNVKDSTEAVVGGASVKLTNIGENTSFDTITDNNGDYAFRNAKAGNYTVAVTQASFNAFTARNVTLVARETLRMDAQLEIGDVAQVVDVRANAGVIATDTPVVQSTLTTESVLSLPSNVRAGGSTSPYALIATLPGVQSDNAARIRFRAVCRRNRSRPWTVSPSRT